MSLRALCSIVVMLLAGPALADTVWLDNGDRLSGEIVLMDGGKLALKTRYAGQVLIDWKDIDTISSDKPLLIKQQGVSGQRSRTLEAAGKGMVRIVDGGSHTVPLASIRQMVPPRPLVEDLVWEGNLDVKLDSKRNDSDKDEWKLKGDTRLRHGAWRHVLAGEVEREKKDGRKVEDNWELDYDLDRFFDEHWFWRGSYSQKHDAIDNLERQSALGTGPGYQFWTTNSGVSTWSPRSVAGNWSGAISRARISPPIRWSGTTSGCSPAPGWSCTAREPCWFPASSGSTTCSTANTACAIA